MKLIRRSPSIYSRLKSWSGNTYYSSWTHGHVYSMLGLKTTALAGFSMTGSLYSRWTTITHSRSWSLGLVAENDELF